MPNFYIKIHQKTSFPVGMPVYVLDNFFDEFEIEMANLLINNFDIYYGYEG